MPLITFSFCIAAKIKILNGEWCLVKRIFLLRAAENEWGCGCVALLYDWNFIEQNFHSLQIHGVTCFKIQCIRYFSNDRFIFLVLVLADFRTYSTRVRRNPEVSGIPQQTKARPQKIHFQITTNITITYWYLYYKLQTSAQGHPY